MNDYIAIDIESPFQKEELYKNIIFLFPEFEWRQGESDAQGSYISGVNEDKIYIKFWLDESPVLMSISFRNCTLDLEKKIKKQKDILNKIKNNSGDYLGKISKNNL